MVIRNFLKKIMPSFFFRFYHFFLALTGALIYFFPSREIKVIALTGTKGKSTSVELIIKILEAAGYKVAAISSIKFKIADKEWPNNLKMTMPGRLTIQSFIRKAVKAGCQYFVLEATSEGIIQYRHKFIDCDVVAFTNLEPEHIERHGSFGNYLRAKLRLFQENKKVHIINLDDKESSHFLETPAKEKIGFTLLSNGAWEEKKSSSFEVINAKDYQKRLGGLYLRVKNEDFNLKLKGRFNAYNVLLSLAVAISQGISLKTAKTALEKIRDIPGRFELIIKEPFKVVVDYAHTPGSLEQVYQTLKDNYQDPFLICLLGSCGGGRDKWKRPKMGRIAAQYCQRIILTNEDPYDEDPLEIIKDIKKGIKSNNFSDDSLDEIIDRRQAIRRALSLARPNNIIIATGKGSEPWMCLADNKKILWQEKNVFLEEFKKILPRD
jgi:UDP-N-acetylmuramoyl-L-alanyl-D-glutamate--2,6-diaminopimelate ligase